MGDRRHRAVLIGSAILCAVWLAAWSGYRLARHAKVTAETLTAQAETLDLNMLQSEARARALADLADQVNRLEAEERRKVRLGRSMEPLFQQMNEEEKGRFIEATMPTGLKQMLTSFEELPVEQRRRAITNALERLQRARDGLGPPGEGSNRPPVLSQELQQKAVTLGLKTFYTESTAQTKAELAPLLEELQRLMEIGPYMRDRP